ncbi:SfiI-subtelomeric fragment related protein family member, putative [Theileria annulata]|uniref:SfiI-subtelomeric related protein family member, putative n=1 Tax=Theileria annulata TaxID=5874 RepID=Q4UCC4_THEAN|nr:SfiI-subtelomeric fragment related protein family member, putative [Theileria annulata]CAI75527.1 SfiI-subtelomeric fragment related protein family member, putative [Theileria annulata]
MNYYKRLYKINSSILHNPLIYNIKGNLINWMYNKPYNRLDVITIYGRNTIELNNIPMGYTPEYIQERLRRYFSKFGIVTFVRCLTHELDPYQCNGIGYVSFRTKKSSLEASKTNLILPFTLHNKIISIQHLYYNTHNDINYYFKQLHFNKQILLIIQQIYYNIFNNGIDNGIFQNQDYRDGNFKNGNFGGVNSNGIIGKGNFKNGISNGIINGNVNVNFDNGIFEKCFYTNKFIKAGSSIFNIFGSWDNFFNQYPINCLFKIIDGKVTLLLCSEERLKRILKSIEIILSKKLDESISINWRLGKLELPEQAKKEANELYHLEPLPEQLQLFSRSHTMYRLHDERYLFKFSLKQKRNQQRKLFRQNKIK